MSDLEALALGRPLVAKFTAQEAYGDEPPLWNTAEIDPLFAVQSILGDPAAAGQRAKAGREWVMRHHSPSGFVDRLVPIYEAIIRP